MSLSFQNTSIYSKKTNVSLDSSVITKFLRICVEKKKIFIFISRDLSNGYAYAEILHAYFPNEINMFAFINGRSLNSRLLNWALIKQFIAKKNLAISNEFIDATIHGREGGAEELLKQTYELLTNKK
jgi:hypothetical protein